MTDPTTRDQAAREYPLDARVWFRDSTQEWVLEVSGTIGDTYLISRHPEPATTKPEDVPGLPSLYAIRDDAPALLAEVESLRQRHHETLLAWESETYRASEQQARAERAEEEMDEWKESFDDAMVDQGAERARAEAAEQVAREAVALLRRYHGADSHADHALDTEATQFLAHHGARTGDSDD